MCLHVGWVGECMCVYTACRQHCDEDVWVYKVHGDGFLGGACV